jgi:hypothetical protein
LISDHFLQAFTATGSVNLNPEAILMIFSSGRIEDAQSDDYRFPVDHWPIRP